MRFRFHPNLFDKKACSKWFLPLCKKYFLTGENSLNFSPQNLKYN